MRFSLNLFALAAIAVCNQPAGAQQPSLIDQLLETNKVHKVTVHNGRATSVRYVPLKTLTGPELTALREAELTGLSMPAGIRAAAHGAVADRKPMVIRVMNGTSVDQIQGRILGVDGDWLIVERPDGIERIRESLVIRIFEPNAESVKPAVSDR